jgi:hypothetical protein
LSTDQNRVEREDTHFFISHSLFSDWYKKYDSKGASAKAEAIRVVDALTTSQALTLGADDLILCVRRVISVGRV